MIKFFYIGVFARSIPRAYNALDRTLRVCACPDSTQNSECNRFVQQKALVFIRTDESVFFVV